MKKFMKVCGIIVGIILVIGIILLAIGSFGGGLKAVKSMVVNGELSFGSHKYINWDKEWVWNVDWDTYDLDEKSMFSSAYDVIRNEASYQTSFRADEISSLNVELGGCKVIIEVSPDSDYHIFADKIGSFQSYVSDGTLVVRALKTGEWVNWNVSTGMKVTIQIPKDTHFTSADLSLGAGIFSIEELSADNCEIEIGAGQVDFESLQASALKCLVGAGQMNIKNAVTTGDVRLEVGAGELIFKGSVPGDMKAECGIGNIELTILNSTVNDHNYRMECMAGNLNAGGHVISGLAVDQDISNGANSNYELICVMGNLTVTFE